MTELKATAKLDLPDKVDENTGQAIKYLAEGFSSLLKLPEKTLNIVEKAGNTLFCVPAALLHGKANIIETKCFIEAQNLRKEKSQIKLAKNVIENLVEKENMGEYIPDAIDDTDNLFAIQNASSETIDDDFIKFWAKLYTEEVCKPNTISKKNCRFMSYSR